MTVTQLIRLLIRYNLTSWVRSVSNAGKHFVLLCSTCDGLVLFAHMGCYSESEPAIPQINGAGTEPQTNQSSRVSAKHRI